MRKSVGSDPGSAARRRGPPPDMGQVMRRARWASDVLKAMAHENRLIILCFLADRECSVTELENHLHMQQATVSQHLARLRHEGLVETRREGRTIHYRLADATTRSFVRTIYAKLCRD